MLQSFRRILPYYARHKRELILGLLCIPFGMALDFYIPIVIGRGLDDLKAHAVSEVIGKTVLIVMGLAVLKGVLRYGMRWWIVGVSRKVESELKEDLFRHLTKLSFSYFNRARSGDILARATQDVEAVRMFTGPGFMYVSSSLLAIPIAFGILLTINAKLTLLVALPGIGLALGMKFLTPRLQKHSQAIQDDLSDLSVTAQENFAGVRVVQGFHREQAEIEKFRRQSEKYREDSLKLASAKGISDAMMDGSKDLAFLIILGLGSFLLIEKQMQLGDLFVFLSYVILLFWPLIALGWIAGMYHRAAAAMRRIDEVFNTQPEIQDHETGDSLAIGGEIEFRNLTFAYNGKPALESISLRIGKGQTLGIVGKTGAGKTTLVSLLPRLFEPPAGTLFLDGLDVRDLPLDRLRRSIGFVPQDNFLFSDSIRENIGFGLEQPSEEIVLAAAETAKIAAEIRGFPNGFEQVIGERGVTLSGGQKQRSSIARALAIDPTILIFDDCLSAVDPGTERELIENLRRAATGRTTLLVAHRLSIVEKADLIIVLGEGRILERGTHAQLLQQGGWYAQTWKRQQIEQELGAL